MRAAFTLLLLTAGCAAEEKPTAWEIVHGTAALTASLSLHPTSGDTLGNFPTRTGELVVADDSTVTGWIKMTPVDSVFTTGAVVNDNGLVMILDSLSPQEYQIFTAGDFPDTYGLLSTASVTGGDAPALHKVYWQFER